MKNNKKKIILCLAVLLILVAAFFFGGNQPKKNDFEKNEPVKVEEREQNSEQKKEEEIGEGVEQKAEAPTEEKKTETAEEKKETPEEKEPTAETEKKSEEVKEEAKKQEPQTEKEENKDGEHTCTLSVRCDKILDNMSLMNSDKKAIVPSDGVIYKEKTVTFYEGESVFNLLVREMKQNKIHLEFVNTPIYNSAYIEGIANIYEFDCGELSGWMYSVNGIFPNYGCSRYELKDGDRVEWIYTCDLGNDIGGNNSARNGM